MSLAYREKKMTKADQFKLVAKILKQYAPQSTQRQDAQVAIAHYKEQYEGKLLELKLNTLLEK